MGMMVCVYCVSHAPALMTLRVPGFEGQNGKLLFYFVVVVQASDVLQYIWGKIFGKQKIAPRSQPEQNVARVHRRCGHGDAAWDSLMVDDSLCRLASGGHVVAHSADGVRRRPGDVGDQARPRCQGLWNTHRGTRGSHRPNRFTLFLSSGLFSHQRYFFT